MTTKHNSLKLSDSFWCLIAGIAIGFILSVMVMQHPITEQQSIIKNIIHVIGTYVLLLAFPLPVLHLIRKKSFVNPQVEATLSGLAMGPVTHHILLHGFSFS